MTGSFKPVSFMGYMDFVKGFISTLGLDSSFFFQLALAVALYFIIARLLFKPYFELMEKRQQLTKGRFAKGRKLEVDIEKLKQEYEKTAKEVYSAFQKDFGRIKSQAESEYKTQLKQLQEEQVQTLTREKERIANEKEKLILLLKSDLPHLGKTLAKKLRGVA